MYLKRLELYGFKTFSRKTEIEYPHGFLAVVGPNGSGKSNLTDAIRFCLGESNVKALRATRLEELIFAGSPTRSPSPFAEVTAVFDNSDGKLPIELSEVAITRRLERDGGSKFQINRTNCRLKDVHELLMGSGIGPGSFSVLGGKEVDRVLSSDPKDRRLMLEETAGVNRYRFRKKEAQRRLAQTQDNLTRLCDIRKEVEDQLAESKRQLQRFQRYQKSQSELKELDRRVALHELSLLGKEKTEIESQVGQAQQELNSAEGNEREARTQLEKLRQEKEKVDRERDTRASDIAALRERAGATRAAHEGLFRRAKELEHNAEAALERLHASTSRIEQQATLVRQLDQKLPELSDEQTAAQNALEEARKERDSLPAPGQGPNAEVRAKLAENEKQKNRVVAQLSQLEARLETEESRVQELTEQQQQLEKEWAEGQPTEELPLEAVKAEWEQAQKQFQELEERRDQGRRRLQECQQRRQQLERDRRPSVSRVAELEALLEDRSGLPPAVRTIMKWNQEGVVGLLGELIRVPEGLEQAFEAALGGHMNDIVTQDRRVASQLIDRLKREKAGRATFWPLDLDRRPPKPPELPDRRGVVGRALELLGYPKNIEKVLAEILGRTVIMEDLNVALQLYDRCFGRRPHLVTREGEYLNPSGALSGGARRKSQAGMLSRRRKLEEARAHLLDVENQLIALSEEEEKIQASSTQLRDELDHQREEVHRCRQRFQELEAEQRRFQSDRERLQGRRDKVRAELERLGQRREEQQLQQQERREEQQKLIAEEELLRAEYERNQAEEDRLSRLRDHVQQELMQAKMRYERVQQSARELEREKNRELQRKQELENDRERAQREHQRCLEARKGLETEGQSLTEQLTTLERQLKEKTEALEELRRSTSSIDEKARKATQMFESASAKLRKWSERVHNLQVELARVAARFDDAQERLKGEEENLKPEPLPSAELENARKRIQRLKNFLDNFGGVNLGAQEDFERLSERFENLRQQLEDLEEGAKSLKKIMAELDKATVARFEHTFHMVNATFSQLFTEMFSGGQARLELCEKDNLLESGVEIVACPPGKKPQNMMLLSSGERALTAIAFLMSLLKHKPSPIVILDELDAPLDERNVEKVATRLVEFSDSSQFLVVTHNRKTMEFADRLYGVTMIEPGISKVMTVQLETVEEELGAPLG